MSISFNSHHTDTDIFLYNFYNLCCQVHLAKIYMGKIVIGPNFEGLEKYLITT